MAEVAQSSGFNAIVAAANKAGLSSMLASPTANITVFAPTDAAFKTLATQLGFADASAMVSALSPADLASILTYHVLPGAKSAADLKAGGTSQPTAYSFAGAPTRLSLSTTAAGTGLAPQRADHAGG